MRRKNALLLQLLVIWEPGTERASGSSVFRSGEAMDGSERNVFIDRAAEMLGVSRRTVYYRIRAGQLRTIRTRGGTRRVLVSSILELLREHES